MPKREPFVRRTPEEQRAYLNGLVELNDPLATAVHAVLFSKKFPAHVKDLVAYRNTIRRLVCSILDSCIP